MTADQKTHQTLSDIIEHIQKLKNKFSSLTGRATIFNKAASRAMH